MAGGLLELRFGPKSVPPETFDVLELCSGVSHAGARTSGNRCTDPSDRTQKMPGLRAPANSPNCAPPDLRPPGAREHRRRAPRAVAGGRRLPHPRQRRRPPSVGGAVASRASPRAGGPPSPNGSDRRCEGSAHRRVPLTRVPLTRAGLCCSRARGRPARPSRQEDVTTMIDTTPPNGQHVRRIAHGQCAGTLRPMVQPALECRLETSHCRSLSMDWAALQSGRDLVASAPLAENQPDPVRNLSRQATDDWRSYPLGCRACAPMSSQLLPTFGPISADIGGDLPCLGLHVFGIADSFKHGLRCVGRPPSGGESGQAARDANRSLPDSGRLGRHRPKLASTWANFGDAESGQVRSSSPNSQWNPSKSFGSVCA